MLRKSEDNPALRVARIYADSALVFTRDTERTTVGGTTKVVMHAGANRVSLHAIRRVSGEGCEGMVGVAEKVGGAAGSNGVQVTALWGRGTQACVTGSCGEESGAGRLTPVARNVRGSLLY